MPDAPERKPGTRGPAGEVPRLLQELRSFWDSTLTPKQREVVGLRASGKMPAEIAVQLKTERQVVANLLFRSVNMLKAARERATKPAAAEHGASDAEEPEPDPVHVAPAPTAANPAEEHREWAVGLARAKARRLHGMDEDDAIGEALLALVGIADRWRPELGSFRSFAHNRVVGAVVDLHRRNDPAGRYQRQMENKGVETAAARRALPRQVPGDVGDLELAGAIHPSAPAGQHVAAELAEALRVLDAELPARDAMIVRRNLVDGESLAAIGADLGVSEARICQVVKSAQRMMAARRPDAVARAPAPVLELPVYRPQPELPEASDDDIELLMSGPTMTQVRRKKTGATMPARHLTREEKRLSLVAYYPEVGRPLVREHCESGMPRPCPFVSCSHHLYLDVNEETGSIKFNFPHLEVWEMAETCSLDVADRGGITLEEVGRMVNLTRERVRQVEVRGLDKIKRSDEAEGLDVLPERYASPLGAALG